VWVVVLRMGSIKNDGLFELANPLFKRLKDPYYLCQAYCKLAVGHFEMDTPNSLLASAVDKVEEVIDHRKKWDLWLCLIETHYRVGELPPIWRFIENAVIEFNGIKEEEWRGLLDRFVPLVTRIRELKWAFKIAESIEDSEKRMYFVNRVVESIGISELTPDIVKQYSQYIVTHDNFSAIS